MNDNSVKTSSDSLQQYQNTWEEKFDLLEQTVKNNNMKTKKRSPKVVAYWTTTIILLLGMASGGMAQLLRLKPNVEGTIHLGYPIYMMSILGTWKMLGVAALLTSKFKLLKEWAYAGFFFDLSAAVISHIASGDGLSGFGAPLFFTLLTLLSWALRPDNQKLPAVIPA